MYRAQALEQLSLVFLGYQVWYKSLKKQDKIYENPTPLLLQWMYFIHWWICLP